MNTQQTKSTQPNPDGFLCWINQLRYLAQHGGKLEGENFIAIVDAMERQHREILKLQNIN